MKDYTQADGQFIKLIEDDGSFIIFKMDGFGVIGTSKKVEVVTEEEYNLYLESKNKEK